MILKSLNNSSQNTDFLDEVAKHKDIDDWFNNIVPCYGLSQDPDGNYLMVMQYMPEGNLRHYLGNKNRELGLKDKIDQLLHIAQGLKDIHQKNLAHRDFHSGNILKGIERTDCLITDLGLCKPVNEISQEDKIFGVMPYVAPEVLRSQPYTQTSDIYSFGIITYEVLSGLPPYYDVEHDIQLALTICQGLRPELQVKIPQLLESLIKRCWDADPDKRPSAYELEKTLRSWEKDTEFKKQLQEAEEFNKNLPDNIKYPNYQKKMHTGAIYTSRLLPTKEITRLLKETGDLYSLRIGKSDIQNNDIRISTSNEIISGGSQMLIAESEEIPPIEIKSEQLENVLVDGWTNINSNFTPQLIQSWQNLNFTSQQTQEWINIGLKPEDYEFSNFLTNTKNLTPLEVLNYNNLENLKQEFQQSIQLITDMIQKTHQNQKQESLSQQIQTKKTELEQLVNSTELKSKLSSIPYIGKKRNKTWRSRLDKLLDRQKRITRGETFLNEKLEKVKKKLEEKLTREEMDNLCQTKIELTELQIKLENLQNQEQQAQIIQTNLPNWQNK